MLHIDNMNPLYRCLQIPESSKVICAVGAGGKTSTLLQIAKEYIAQNKRVCMTTTTKLYRPTRYSVLDGNLKHIQQQLQQTGFVIAGLPVSEQKIGALDNETYQAVCELSDIVLVECDGSKRLPWKLPQTGEPVLPNNIDTLIVVMGLSAIGQTWEHACHRYFLYTQQKESILSPQNAIASLQKGYGQYLQQSHTILYLNQADTISKQTFQEIQKQIPYHFVYGSIQYQWWYHSIERGNI